jgi:hypothetical protein
MNDIKEDCILDLHDMIDRVKNQKGINGYFLMINVDGQMNMRKYDAENIAQLLGMMDLLLTELKVQLVNRNTDLDVILDD